MIFAVGSNLRRMLDWASFLCTVLCIVVGVWIGRHALMKPQMVSEQIEESMRSAGIPGGFSDNDFGDQEWVSARTILVAA